MKFVMNGGLIIGTMDGANVEISQEIGKENMFIFGMDVAGVGQARKSMYEGNRDYVGSRLRNVLNALLGGQFGDINMARGILEGLPNGNDHYVVCQDFYSYLEAQERVDATYRDYKRWTKMAIIGVAKSGFFSSDRTIKQYCNEIWKIEPVSIPQPSSDETKRVRSFANLPTAEWTNVNN